MLEFIESSLDEVAGFVDLFIIATLNLSVTFGWNHSLSFHITLYIANNSIGIVSLVRKNSRCFLSFEKTLGLGAIRCITARKP
jgi:hypothetical protein